MNKVDTMRNGQLQKTQPGPFSHFVHWLTFRRLAFSHSITKYTRLGFFEDEIKSGFFSIKKKTRHNLSCLLAEDMAHKNIKLR